MMKKGFTPKDWESLSMDHRPKVRYWLPAAAVDLDDLKEEIHQLYERGFGGVEIVSLHRYAELHDSEEGWGGERWDEVLQVVADTTAELGMTMDLTNGPGWPISMPTITSPDDPAVIHELTYGVTVCPENGHYKGKLPERRTVREGGTSKVVHVLAYLQNEEGRLVKDSYQDLREYLTGDTAEDAVLDCHMPRGQAGCQWLIFAFYCQPSMNTTSNGRYFVVDHMSKAGTEACRKYWKPIFEKYDYPSMESIFCDSLEYRTRLDWTPLLPEEFEKRRGYSILPYLPFIGTREKMLIAVPDRPGYQLEDPALADMINEDYLETLTQLYCEYHLGGLSELTAEYGKNVRYQVAYNKPMEMERSALYVNYPENEALGRPSMDYLKGMAAAVHLGRKKRLSFECAAEFGHSYGQDYEDLLWWIKRSLMSGINLQVLHGASYSGAYHGALSVDGALPGTEWPGFEAFGKGVSNYWNRTPSMEDARGCLETVARMNALFQKKAKVDCAIYHASYAFNGLGAEFCFYPDGGRLMNAGYTYETVSPALLELPVCHVTNGELDEDGVGYRCLIVQEQEAVPVSFLEKLRELQTEGLPVVWVGARPQHSSFYGDWLTEEKKEYWNKLMDAVWQDESLIHADTIEEVPELLRENGIQPRAKLEGNRNVVAANHVDEENRISYYGIYAYKPLYRDESLPGYGYTDDTIKPFYKRPGRVSRNDITVSLEGEGQVYLCNPWDGSTRPLDFVCQNGRMTGTLSLEEDELLILAIVPEESATSVSAHRIQTAEYPVQFSTLSLQAFGPAQPGEKSFLRSAYEEQSLDFDLQATGLLPWKDLKPELENFAGRGIYQGTFELPSLAEGSGYLLHLGDASDTFHVTVNGVPAGFPDQVLKEVDITGLVKEGINTLTIEVTSNLYNNLIKEASGGFFAMARIPRNYGIWNRENDSCCVQVLVKER